MTPSRPPPTRPDPGAVDRQSGAGGHRERLLAAMLETVAARGYAAASVADVVARAAVSRRTFYEHFADKEDCFLAAFDAAFADIFASVLAAYDAQAEWPARVAAGLSALLDRLVVDPAVARVGVVEVLAAGQRAVERRDAALSAFQVFFDPQRPEVPDHDLPPIVAEATIGGIYEVMYRCIVTEGPEALRRMRRDLVKLALGPFIGPEAALQAARQLVVRPARPRTDRSAAPARRRQ